MNIFSVISIKSLSILAIKSILKESESIKNFPNHYDNLLSPYIVASLFYEPSTRTSLSFQSAVCRMNGKNLILNEEYSSAKKGESLYDTIKTVENYADVLILRHPEVGIFEKICKSTNLPIINAGDGSGEHPTQALLDLFTILLYHKPPFKIALCGDIKNSRTIHSLINILDKLYDNIFIFLVSCDKLKLDKCLLPKNKFQEVDNLNQIIKEVDVIYMTRLQKERWCMEEFNHQNVKITEELLDLSKNETILMHPLPRNDEIPSNLDNHPKSKYFEQVKNGVIVRMAILKYVLNI